jgi:pre-mRNA-processing factor 6
MSGRKDFLSQPAPENYVAGLGRGATGFTTRSDLGPAREGPSDEQLKDALAKRAKALELDAPTAYGVKEKKDEDEDDERFQDPDNEVGLFANGLYDKDDDEADRIYQEVDEKLEKRRRYRREAREQREREEYEAANPKISQQFADAKRALSAVTEEEWANLPEVGDLTGRNKRARTARLNNRFFAVPDSVLAQARDANAMDTSIDANDSANGSSASSDGVLTDFAQIGAARERQLQVRLDQAQKAGSGTSTGTSTSVDAKGYLTSLSKSEADGAPNIGDINRTRQLLESVVKSNPTHPPGWISAARLEEVAGKIVAARNLAMRGCRNCPKSEDVWLEAIRLHMEGNNQNSKVIAADAVKANPKSTKLWIAAMELERESAAKKKILRMALDENPKTVELWKVASNLEEERKDAVLMLAKAVQFVPLSVELWLAYARLCDEKEATIVLNQARKAVPTSPDIWIAAARLQEQAGNHTSTKAVMQRAMKGLSKANAMKPRDDWLEMAWKVESDGAPVTAAAIIENTLGYNLEEDEATEISIWMSEAKKSIERGCYFTARAIYAYAARQHPRKADIWKAAAKLELDYFTKEDVYALLSRAVHECPQSDELWLYYSRTLVQAGELAKAKEVLSRAYTQTTSDDIYLAGIKLELDDGNRDKARKLLKESRARDNATDRVWVKSVAFERALGDDDSALDLVLQALQLFPANSKLWMMKGQIYEAKNMLPKAREAYNTGTRVASKSVPLWLLASRLEERSGILVKARSILDRARLAIPNNEVLWTESVRLERRAGSIPTANNVMAQALQQLPKSGMLWAEKVLYLEPRAQRKARSLEAVRIANNDQHIHLTVARVFWAERKLDKAVNWFERAILHQEDWGDTWAWYYKFLLQHGTEEKKEEVLSKVNMVEPKHGEVWQQVAKDPKNFLLKPSEILKKAVDYLQ